MPRKPKKPCAYPGCPNLTEKKYCPEHERLESQRYDRYQRDPAHKKRYGKAWKRMATTFEKQATLAWNLIFQVVKENCTKDFSGATPNDEMEMLLRSRS